MCTNNKNETVLLFSGGIDSFVAYHFLDRPRTVYFDLKTKYSAKELEVVQSFGFGTIIDESLNLGDREYGNNAFVPFRNLLLAAQAYKYGNNIVIAGVKDDNVGDKNSEIFGKMSKVLSEMVGEEVNVYSPFWDMHKDEVIAWYLKQQGMRLGEINLLQTISCYSERNTNYCGECPSCFRKWVALYSNGIKLNFYNRELMVEYYGRAKAGLYLPHRNENIIKSVDDYSSRHRWYIDK